MSLNEKSQECLDTVQAALTAIRRIGEISGLPKAVVDAADANALGTIVAQYAREK